jgi:hypothetical protein
VNKPRPILRFVRVALGTTVTVSGPLGGIAAEFVEYPTVAECEADHVTSECTTPPPKAPDVQHEDAPAQRAVALPVAEARPPASPPPPEDVPMEFFDDDGLDETHRIVQEILRHQRNFIAPFQARVAEPDGR